jgi:hypothetical protein
MMNCRIPRGFLRVGNRTGTMQVRTAELVLVPDRVRVNSSVRRAGRDRVRVSNYTVTTIRVLSSGLSLHMWARDRLVYLLWCDIGWTKWALSIGLSLCTLTVDRCVP